MKRHKKSHVSLRGNNLDMILHCITPITLSNFWLKACDITIKSFYYLLSMDISSHFHIYSLTMFLQISFWYNISYFYIPLVKSNNLYMNMSVFIMKFLHSKLFTYTTIHFYQIYQMNMLPQKMKKWSYFLCLDEQKLRWMIFCDYWYLWVVI